MLTYPLAEDTQYWFYYMDHALDCDGLADSYEDINDEFSTYCAGQEL